jgi:hypothetical protein
MKLFGVYYDGFSIRVCFFKGNNLTDNIYFYRLFAAKSKHRIIIPGSKQ